MQLYAIITKLYSGDFVFVWHVNYMVNAVV